VNLLLLLEEVIARILSKITFAPRGTINTLVNPKMALNLCVTSWVVANFFLQLR